MRSACCSRALFFEPTDLPQYGMNVTTLLVPLFAIQALAARVIARDTAYVDLSIARRWRSRPRIRPASWPGSRSGRSMARASVRTNLVDIATFAASYALVIVIEPLADLGVLALAKSLRGRHRAPASLPRVCITRPERDKRTARP